jgi:hypothetical protein
MDDLFRQLSVFLFQQLHRLSFNFILVFSFFLVPLFCGSTLGIEGLLYEVLVKAALFCSNGGSGWSGDLGRLLQPVQPSHCPQGYQCLHEG